MIYLLLFAVAAYLGACFHLAQKYIRPDRIIAMKPAGLKEVDVDTRFGPTPSWETDGLAKSDPSDVVFVMAHGYGGTRETWADVMLDLKTRGYDSVALSMPGQDASPARNVGFGISEGHVVADAVKWVRSQTKRPVKVVVLGLSMGGAAAWLASAEDPGIDGIVTEGAYARFDEAMNSFFNRKMPGGSYALAPVVTFAKWMTGLHPEEVRPVDAAGKWKGKPALVIQGGADTLIAGSQAQALASAAGCPIWLVPGAEHAMCFETDRKGYLEHLCAFAGGLALAKTAIAR